MELKIKNSCGADVFWEIQGPGVFTSGVNSKEASFQATYEAGTIIVTANLTNLCAQCGGPIETLMIEFDIITPEATFLQLDDFPNGDLGVHEKDRVSAGFVANVFILPDDVNFYNVKFQEGDPMPEISGDYFVEADRIIHNPSPPHQASDMVYPGKGTKLANNDLISFYFYCDGDGDNERDAGQTGTYKYDIEYYYVNESTEPDAAVPFDILDQDFGNINNAATPPGNPKNLTSKRSRVSHALANITYNLKDPTTTVNFAPLLNCN